MSISGSVVLIFVLSPAGASCAGVSGKIAGVSGLSVGNTVAVGVAVAVFVGVGVLESSGFCVG